MAFISLSFLAGPDPLVALNASAYHFRVSFLPLVLTDILILKRAVSFLGYIRKLHPSTPALIHTSNRVEQIIKMDTGLSTNDIVTDPYLQSVLEASTHTRRQCISLIDLAEANPIAASNTSSLDVQLELSKQQRIVHSYLGQLRGLNRNAIALVRNTKQLTAEARQEIDRLHLQLQNLYYEERHLRGEIAACDSYE